MVISSGTRAASPTPSVSNESVVSSVAGGNRPEWYLEAIHLKNFKSYNGEVTVGPLKPFVAIIGPNGSGKSNLMDAVSFVMGERTASLRVRCVSELIHGASFGKPVSSHGSVTAVFKPKPDDGGEENLPEMRFTRAINGKSSKYLINGQELPHKQYILQLKQLGINAKGKNFLVFQGTVENISMKNSKERCALLEEICGSSSLKEEYEKKRAEFGDAQRKLEMALMKKKAVTQERRSIKAEVQDAKVYTELLDKQAEMEKNLYLFKLFYNSNDLEEIQGNLVGKNKELHVLGALKQKTNDELKEKKRDRGELNRLLSVKESEQNAVEKEKNKLMPKLISLEERGKHLIKKIADAEKSLKKANANIASHQEDVKSLNESLKTNLSKEKAFLDEHSHFQQSRGVDVHLRDSQMKEYWKLKHKVLQDTQKEKQEIESLQRKKKDADEEHHSLNRQKVDLDSKLDLKNHEIKEMKKLGGKTHETILELTAQLKAKEEEAGPLRTQVVKAEGDIERLQQELTDISNQIDTMKVDKYEAMRKKKMDEVISALQSHFVGVKGRVSHRCNPRHSRHTIAITKIMGKNMEAIIVDTERTARRCIEYLKEQMLDPEVFLPLDILEVKPLFTQLCGRVKDAYLAYDLVQFDQDVEKAILHCVKSTIVCSSASTASKVAAGVCFDGAVNAVSLDGTMYATTGIISGGMAELQRKAKRWDDKALAEMDKKKSQLTEALREAIKLSRGRVQLDSLMVELGGIKNRLKYAEKDFQANVAKAKGLEKAKAELTSELESIMDRWRNAEEKNRKLGENIKKLQKTANSKEDKIFEKFCDQIRVPNIRAYEESDIREQEEFNRKRADFQQQIQQIKTKIDFETEQQQALADNKARWETTKSELTENLNKCKTEDDSVRREMDRINDNLLSVENRVKELKENIDGATKAISDCNKKLVTAEKALSKAQYDRTHLLNDLTKTRNSRHDLYAHCKLTGINIPMENGTIDDITIGGLDVGQSTEETGYTEEDVIQVDFSELKRDLIQLSGPSIASKEKELELEVHNLETKIRSFQAPNMKANERWGNINNRAREQQAEFDEIRKMTKVASEAFEKVKMERLGRFMKCYDQISKNIDGIYKALTQNDAAQAVLGLNNAEEPYLDGISYSCLVPGKRFQPMSNLSGGEKTLAALALLFAIHSFESSPFFVLDEIDAALDKTNIAKVSAYMKQSTRNFQILVISLKEDFYENVDALVGVAPSVEEETAWACSKVYTLNLEEYDL